MAGLPQSAGAEALSPSTRSLAEVLAERLDLAVGHTRLELEYEDGRLLRIHRHEKIAVTALGRFDRQEAG